MPLCHICTHTFSTFNDLWKHLKLFHHLHANSRFHCAEKDCLRVFLSINSYRKHWSAHHSDSVTERTDNDEISSLPHDTPSSCQVHVDLVINESSTTPSLLRSENEQQNVNPPMPLDFGSKINQDVLKLVSSLYSLPTLPRSHVQSILKLFESFFKDNVQILRDEFQSLMQITENASSNIFQKMSHNFDLLDSAFNEFQTEHQCFKMLANEGYFFLPRSYVIGRTFKRIQAAASHVNAAEVKVMGQIYPLRRVLKAIFEIPRVYNEAMSYKQKLESESDVLSNFIQGELWKSKVKHLSGKKVFPLFLYYDDYEVGNPLGSHAGVNKLGGVYISIPCFPPEYTSAISSTYHALIFHANDRKKFGNSATFRELIQELSSLEHDGVEIVSESGTEILYFKLGLIIGDNLGLNTLLGFVESFSANYYCRFCKMHKSDMQQSCTENVELLRKKETYDNDVLTDNVTLTGIKEKCVFNDLPDFHAVDNWSVDVMHDMFRGVCEFDMVEIIKYFTQVVNLFTLDDLNSRIVSYDYGPVGSNIPPEISEIHLKKNSINMSASEMWCFVTHFGLMCGDMVPQNNTVWQFYLTLRKIVALVTCPCVQEECATLLGVLIEEHHQMWQLLFRKPLKPKHHNLTHYPRIIRECGPLIHLWAMRFESTHQESKAIATSTKSRRNVGLTISMKNQLILADKILSKDIFSDSFSFGPGNYATLNELPFEFDANVKISKDEKMLFVKWVKKFGTTYKQGMTICIGDDDGRPKFGIIKYIFMTDNSETSFIFQELETELSAHLFAYKIYSYNLSCEYIKMEELLYHTPFHITKMYGQQFIVHRYYL